MVARVYHLVLLLDFAIGAVFAMVLLAGGMFAFSATGGFPQIHEMRAFGGAYTDLLARIETEVRQLRADYCANAEAEAAAQANCGASGA